MPLVKVGSPLPYQLEGRDGCTTFIEPTRGDEGIDSMFVVSLTNIDQCEFDALREWLSSDADSLKVSNALLERSAVVNLQ